MDRTKHQEARSKLEQVIDQALDEASTQDRPLSLIALDIDDFRGVNTTYGHDVGDRVLTDISSLAQQQIRDSDSFMRYGGDEWVILAPDTTLSDAKAMAERIRKAVESHEFAEAKQVTISLGVATYRTGDTAASLIERADGAAYRAKIGGRNRVEIES